MILSQENDRAMIRSACDVYMHEEMCRRELRSNYRGRGVNRISQMNSIIYADG